MDQAYAKISIFCNARLRNKRQNKKSNSDVTENLWCKTKNVMQHLADT